MTAKAAGRTAAKTTGKTTGRAVRKSIEVSGEVMAGEVIGGVDTHSRTHHAAVIDAQGRFLADRQFEATAEGYRLLLAWLSGHGPVRRVGVEGTGAYGAQLARVRI